MRRIREKLARQFDYDIHAIFADLRAREHRDDPDHPLVNDARGWAEAAESAMALREKPEP